MIRPVCTTILLEKWGFFESEVRKIPEK